MRSRPARVRNSSRLSLESLEDRLAPATFTVSNDNNSGPGSLRAAINAANAAPGADYIRFKIPGGGTHRIDLLSALPAITDKLTINAASEPGYAGSPLIVLNGADAGAGVSGLVVRAAGSVVRGLVINEFAVDGIRVRANNCRIAGCYVGTDEAGAVALGNGFSGVHIFAGAKNVAVGGDGPFGGNVLSGNGNAGVEIGQATGNTVKRNVVGLSADGLTALPNALGVLLADGATKNVIGGEAGNTISGNLAAGVSIVGTGTSGNVVSGNRIGTDVSGNEVRANRGNGVLMIDGAKSNVIRDNTLSGNDANGLEITGVNTTGNVATGNRIGLNAAGTTVLANDVNGVLISSGAANNTIGGNTAADRNLIAGNLQNGVLITGPGTTGNTVLGNLIGTDVTGTLDLGNAGNGVHITAEATDNVIGGTEPGARNTISGNELSGIFVEGIGTTGTVIQGNLLGTDVTGTLDLGNGDHGVRTLEAANTLIGGVAPGARNIISGNDWDGVFVEGAGTAGTKVQGNYVGTDVTGSVKLGNHLSGVTVYRTTGVLVGGTAPGEGNVVSGNGHVDGFPIPSPTGSGVLLEGPDSTGNIVQGNLIGTDATGTIALGNAVFGLWVFDGSSNNLIGGSTPGAGNVIAGSSVDDVMVWGIGNDGNVFQGNLIGTDKTGTVALSDVPGPFGGSGVVIGGGASNNVVGGTAEGERNVISGHRGAGVVLGLSGGSGNVIQGNFIGTDVTGTLGLGNGAGVTINGANNVVGGLSPGAGNVISGNGTGVFISGLGSSGNVLQGNFIGTDVTGTSRLGNAEDGVHITGGAADNLIGGADPGARNVISGNELSSIFVEGIGTTGTLIQGNYLGTDVTGTLALGNGNYGVRTLDAANTLIGGSAPGARNIISGNDLEGVFVEGAGAIGTRIQGNYVGTDVTGSAMLGNRLSGVVISRTTGVLVGGAAPGEGNVISGNGHPDPNGNSTGSGVRVTGLGSTGNVVQGNLIGTDATGTLPLGNAFMGVMLVTGATGNLIGGSTPGAGNVISSNRSNVVVIGNGTDGNVIQGNFIGTDVTGTVVLNGAVSSRVGVDLSTSSSNTVVGGVAAGERNVIAGHSIAGVYISGEPGNIVQGNYIGTDVTGTLDLGNAVGVTINNTGGNVIGGTVPGAGNLISGNSTGVLIHGADASGNLIQGNLIGTDVTSTLDLGNDNEGIRITQNASGNVIGGVEAGTDNVVAYNGGQGVWIDGGSGNSVLGNSIFDNDALGIDLGLEGLTPNDLNDADTGPNDLLNFPVLASAVLGGGDVLVTGSINTERFKSLRIELFINTETDASGHGEGEIFIGFLDVEMGDNNTVNFDVLLQGDQVEPGQFITATATDELGNTSEFSLALAVS